MRIPNRLQVAYGAFLLAACLLTGAAAARELPAAVASALKRAGIPPQAVATYVQEVTDKKILIASNVTAAFQPASTMKLVTTDAALELLGPTYVWKTQAYAEGVQTGDVLQGDLIIKGSGDPKLVIEKFWLFLRQIRAKGIREIRGNLVLDRSVFEEVAYDPAQFDSDPMKPYNVGSDALLLNYKAFRLQFTPDLAHNQVRVTVEPPVADYPIGAPKLSNGDCGDWQDKLRAVLNGNSAGFGGTFAASCGEKTWYVHPHLMTSTQYFGAVFRQLWADLGGTLKGEVKNGATPQGARLLAVWESPALSEVIRDINKFSNNVMARQLLLTLAADVLKQPANPTRGAAVIKTWFAEKGIDASDLSIENGSGLSRTERISAQTMGQMLIAAFHAPIMPEFISSLSLVGYDGTMRRRLAERSVAGNAHIKTGRLDDVRAIAGYVLAASGKRYVVVCFINHAYATRGQAAQDALLQWIYENG